jgi:hypothetical protein
MPERSAFTIAQAFLDRRLFACALDSEYIIESWLMWLTILCAAFALPLTAEQAQTFAQISGGRLPPTKAVRELWCIAGRRSGKSRIAALIACYLALFGRHRTSVGERPMVLVLAGSIDQAATVFGYVVGFLQASPVLRQEIASIKRHEITLKNGVIIAVHSNSYRTVRGRTLIACIMDEVAFFRDESSATPDIECYRAVMPAMATQPNAMLIAISTPYRKMGLLHQKHKDYFGVDDDETLVVQGPSQTFNPTLSARTIATQTAADPTAAASEWQAEFRSDLSSFLDDALVEAAIEPGRPLELPPTKTLFGSIYKAYTDASGGVGQDAYTLSVCHRDGEQFVCDLVRGTPPGQKFDPQQVTQAYADLLREYGIHSVTGDAYSAQWVAGAWTGAGVSYVQSDLPKSRIYLEVLPLFARGLVKLPDHPTLLRELRLLERQTHRGGRDSVDHPRGGHDDHANALCGALRQLSDHTGYDQSYAWVDGNPINGDDAVLTDAQRAERRKAEAEEWHRQRLTAYIASHGGFGFGPPFGQI